jgi:hypothetical protein
MTMLEKLKVLSLDRMSVDEGVELLTVGRQAASTYDALGLPKPEWLTKAVTDLEVDLNRRREDLLQAEISRLLNRKAALRTRDEERADIDAQLAAARGKLGNATA